MDVAIYVLGIVGTIALALAGMVYSHNKSLAIWIFFSAVVALEFGGSLFWQQQISKQDSTPETGKTKEAPPKIAYFGGLTPGTEPGPQLPPGVPVGTIQLLLGDDLRILSASANPVFSKDGKTFLSIGVRDGLMRLTATLVDKTNQYICRIIDNEFQISQERAFNPKQPDAHSLIVRDADGVEVLNLRFLNPTAMRITGRFQLPGSLEPVLVLSNDGIQWPGGAGIGHVTLDVTKSKASVVSF